MKLMSGQETIQVFESFAPKSLALEGDKIGLQVGTLNKPINRVMVTLDVLETVVDEAIKHQVDLIIAHHPVIFRPLKQVNTDLSQGRMIEKLLKHDITVYAAHTNLDVTNGGVNDLLAAALGLTSTKVLVPTFEEQIKKLVVFVPEEEVSKVRDALAKAGAGHIGAYSHCTFSSQGEGTFLPLAGTQPFIGEQGKLAYVKETKLETVFPAQIERKVISALKQAHPYEEPAYDIYQLASGGETLGLGRIGRLPKPMTLGEFASDVKTRLQSKGVRVVGDLNQQIEKVAILGGDGNKYITEAKRSGADVYVTGDVYYHTAHDAQALGLSLVDPGHNVEKIMKEAVKNYLTNYIAGKNYATDVIISEVDTDPFTFI